MKLLYCKKCDDVFRIYKEPRSCRCGKTKGKYLEDGLHAVYQGEGVPLGIGDGEFNRQISKFPFNASKGKNFDAWVTSVDSIRFQCVSDIDNEEEYKELLKAIRFVRSIHINSNYGRY